VAVFWRIRVLCGLLSRCRGCPCLLAGRSLQADQSARWIGARPSVVFEETAVRHRGFAPLPTPLDWHGHPSPAHRVPRGTKQTAAASQCRGLGLPRTSARRARVDGQPRLIRSSRDGTWCWECHWPGEPSPRREARKPNFKKILEKIPQLFVMSS
jgi:hypothetical protein